MSTFDYSCPIPTNSHERVLLAHGGGGRLSRALIDELIGKVFDDPLLSPLPDAASLVCDGRVALTTDAYVVNPLIFPGGSIGSLAVHGTVNDLAVVGAKPRWISVALILEEGLLLQTLWDVLVDMRRAADEARVRIVTGDTKVVERGRGDGIYVTTTGLGDLPEGVDLGAHRIRPGDHVICSGDLGRHGVAVLASREGLRFGGELCSDSAPLNEVIEALLDASPETHCMRDLTRGGLATALVELAQSAEVEVAIDEREIMVEPTVRGACETLGLDPMHVANEGRFVAFIPEPAVGSALNVMRSFDVAKNAADIGVVRQAERARVIARSVLGTTRVVDMLSGSLLPRIC